MAQPSGGATSRATAVKIVVSVAAAALAIGFLLTRSLEGETHHYKHVDELMAHLDDWRGKRLKVHGHVVPGSIEQAKGTLQYRFKIESRPAREGERAVHAGCTRSVISAVYTGLVPDTFKSDSEVVATGMLAGDNTLAVAPDGVMAKCPSKYEAEKSGGATSTAAAAAAAAKL